MSFQCILVTPEAQVFDQIVTGAILPAFDGMIGVETGRAPILMRLGAGKLTLHVAGKSDVVYFIEGGVAQMKDNKLTVLSDKAITTDKLDLDAAKKDIAVLSSPGTLDEAAFIDQQKRLQRAQAVVRTVGAAS